ncbi:hypothetical protein LCGC14_2640390, partial [marine sediment metagenome]
FLLTKSPQYYYDAEAIREPGSDNSHGGGQIHDGRYSFQSGRHDGNSSFNCAVPAGANGKNKRTVWWLSSEAMPEAHFATFPQKLVEPCVLAGCPPKVCVECGEAWTRIVEKEFIQTGIIRKMGETDPSVRWHGFPRGKTNSNLKGWQPTCECNAPTQPGIVLDMFMGSGTTAVVATKLGRHFMGCELNSDYVDIAERRLIEESARGVQLPNDWEPEKAELKAIPRQLVLI